MTVLYGLHDRESRHIVPAGGWCLDVVALSENPQPTDYAALRADINWIVRLSWGFGSTGAIPLPERFQDYASACARYVSGSNGADIYIIGNEIQHEQERPNGVYINPEQYVRCFLMARDAIKKAKPNAQIIPAPCAPYHANPINWLDYWRMMLEMIAVNGGCDGLAVHAYTRSADPSEISSEAKMGAPLQDQYAGFRTYRDALGAVPDALRHLPVYITEFNELLDEGWHDRNTGVVQAAYEEIYRWNRRPDTQKIRCLILYRWPKYDKWHIEGKQGVIDDFRAAVARSYPAPQSAAATNEPNEVFMPTISTGPTTVQPAPIAPGGPQTNLPPRKIGEDFKRRVPEFTAHTEVPGRKVYRLIKAEYVPDGARRFGPDHHILVDVLDANGKRQMGAPVNFYWADGMEITTINKVSEPYGADYGMTSAGHGFGVWVGNFREASDDVFGMGLGKIGSEQMGEHVDYYLVYQEGTIPAASQPAPKSDPGPPAKVPLLAHPVRDPKVRRVTQPFGVNGDYYKQFSVDDVPLKGHEGIDFGTPVGAVIVAVDDGRVVEAADQGDKGYGRYVKLVHAWGESVYAHLDEHYMEIGQEVRKGEHIANSGNTGNSTGPHLHLGLRIAPFNRKDGWGGYSDPAPYLINVPAQPVPSEPGFPNTVALIKSAATEFGLDWHLLASLAWGESSFQRDIVSQAGAQGLMQLMPGTFAEWSPRVRASDPFDAKDNLRTGAAYFAHLLRHLDGDTERAIWAYNWGVGNVSSGKTPPAETLEFANKVLHGRDLLRAVGA